MDMEFDDRADTRNRVRNLERELRELRSYVERLERQVEENSTKLTEHSHYPLSPDFGKATYAPT